MPHKITGGLKTGPKGRDDLGSAGGRQRAILPLKIIFGVADEIKDSFDGLVDVNTGEDVDHLLHSFAILRFVSGLVCGWFDAKLTQDHQHAGGFVGLHDP